MRRLLTLLLGLLTALVAGGCITDPVTGRSVVGMPTTEAEESTLGLGYKPEIVHEFGGPYPDARLQQHLGGIVLGMAKRTVRPDLPWSFTVLNTSVPNAFAIPGGQVFVTRGLLANLEDEAEFAVVMGHELGHVEHRHSIQQQGQQLLIGGILAGVQMAAGDKWTSDYDQVAQLLAGAGISKFSRDDERESDARGVENAYAAGYDPREGGDVFRMFLRLKQEGGGGGLPDWLSSHPADEERIESIARLSAQKDPRLAGKGPVPGLKSTTPAWSSLMSRLKHEQKTYDRYDAALARIDQAKGSQSAVGAALPEFRRCAQELPDHAVFAAAVGKALLILGDEAAARAELQRASAMNQQIVEPEYLLGALALRSKDWNRALSFASRGLQVLPDNASCLSVRGAAAWNLGRKAEAERDLQAVIAAAPKDSEPYRRATEILGAPAAAPAPKAVAPKRPRGKK